MKNINVVELRTQGDCEGKSTSTVGIFIGSIDQIITYCIKNNIKPYYNFYCNLVKLTDVSDISPEVKVTIDNIGYLSYSTPEKLEKEAKKQEALNKLTEEERVLLGLK